MPIIRVQGIDLFYEESGDGLPLLLLPGFATHGSIWRPQLPALAAHFRVLVLDLPGAGRSPAPPLPQSTRQMAALAAALLDALSIAQVHVVGWSMGGMVAQELALLAPGRVDRLVLLASAAGAPATFGSWLTFVAQGYQASETGGLDPAGFHLNLLPWLYTPAFMTQPDRVEAAVHHALADQFAPTAAGVAIQAEACRLHTSGDIAGRLSGIGVPTLVLAGAEDIVFPPPYARALAAAIPDARLHILERGGHGVALEYADPVNAALIAFLTETSPNLTQFHPEPMP